MKIYVVRTHFQSVFVCFSVCFFNCELNFCVIVTVDKIETWNEREREKQTK